MVRIVAIGNINIDLIAFLDELPGLDEGREAKEWVVTPGGSGSNFSVAARSLGAEVELYAAIGTGYFSKKIVEELESRGVKVFGPLKEGEQSIIFIASTPKGKVMYSLKGVSHTLRPEELPEQYGADVLHIASKGTAFVRKYLGVERISYSPGPYTFEEKESVREVVSEVDYMFLNLSEAKALGLYPKPSLLPRKLLAITMGENGSIIYTREKVLRVVALKVKPVDTTGAGDVYAAAFLVTLLKDNDLEKACRVASAAGAIAVTRPGGFVELSPEEVLKMADLVTVREMKTSPTPEE